MTNATKGALLSGLALPGLGQIALKRYARGAVFVVLSLASATAFVAIFGRLVYSALRPMILNDGTIEAAEISPFWGVGALMAWLVFLIVAWVAATVDAYVIGRKMDADGQE